MRDFNPAKVPSAPLHTAPPPWINWSAPIDLEIGSGTGLFAIRSSRAAPERTFIAIERTEKFLRFEKRLSHHSPIGNLHAVRADAVNWVTHFVPEKSLDRVFILYPNPYPKPKQSNLRWPNMPFMGFLISRLKDGGRLIIATNIESYAEEAAKQLNKIWHLDTVSASVIKPHSQPRTHFEKKYLLRGDVCWNLEFKRACSGPPKEVPRS